MEFNEKLQKLRAGKNLTQEELSEKLYVSRTAISKWESGRGYPSIDSLKAIAKYFNITIDELIRGEEMVTLAEQDIKESNKKYTYLVCGILDCLILLLFFIPIFGNGSESSVSSAALFEITGISTWIKNIFIVTICVTVLNGFCTVVFSSFNRPKWNRHLSVTGVILSVIGTTVFMVSRQPYAGIFYFFILVTKGILLLKSK